MNSIKPFSQACVENQDPILDVLRRQFENAHRLLEIGSGTGQHAAYFPKFLSHVLWQPSDVEENIAGIELWRQEAQLENVLPSLILNVSQHWPDQTYDAVFSANTAHIMSISEVQAMIGGVSKILSSPGTFCLYGPFKLNGSHTSESNARFDAFLRQRDPASGVRDVADLEHYANTVGMALKEMVEMPTNNKILVFCR